MNFFAIFFLRENMSCDYSTSNGAQRDKSPEKKAQKADETEQGRRMEQPLDNEPINKRPRMDSMNVESSENNTGEEEEEDSMDRFLQVGEDEELEEEGILNPLGQYFNDDTEIGPKRKDGLAKMANNTLRGKVQPEKLKKLAEKYKRPANVVNLQVPKVEKTKWKLLHKEAKGTDYLLQETQSSFSLALILIIKAVGTLHNSKNKELKPLLELVTDSFKILTLVLINNHKVRRDKIKKEPKYRGICNKETSTTKLFSDQLQEAVETFGDSS